MARIALKWLVSDDGKDVYAKYLNLVRLGSFPHVAARTIGVTGKQYNEWMLEGGKRSRGNHARFFSDTMQAIADASSLTEAELRTSSGKAWLQSGPRRYLGDEWRDEPKQTYAMTLDGLHSPAQTGEDSVEVQEQTKEDILLALRELRGCGVDLNDLIDRSMSQIIDSQAVTATSLPPSVPDTADQPNPQAVTPLGLLPSPATTPLGNGLLDLAALLPGLAPSPRPPVTAYDVGLRSAVGSNRPPSPAAGPISGSLQMERDSGVTPEEERDCGQDGFVDEDWSFESLKADDMNPAKAGRTPHAPSFSGGEHPPAAEAVCRCGHFIGDHNGADQHCEADHCDCPTWRPIESDLSVSPLDAAVTTAGRNDVIPAAPKESGLDKTPHPDYPGGQDVRRGRSVLTSTGSSLPEKPSGLVDHSELEETVEELDPPSEATEGSNSYTVSSRLNDLQIPTDQELTGPQTSPKIQELTSSRDPLSDSTQEESHDVKPAKRRGNLSKTSPSESKSAASSMPVAPVCENDAADNPGRSTPISASSVKDRGVGREMPSHKPVATVTGSRQTAKPKSDSPEGGVTTPSLARLPKTKVEKAKIDQGLFCPRCNSTKVKITRHKTLLCLACSHTQSRHATSTKGQPLPASMVEEHEELKR